MRTIVSGPGPLKPASFSPFHLSNGIYSTDFDWRPAEGWPLGWAWAGVVTQRDMAQSSWRLCWGGE